MTVGGRHLVVESNGYADGPAQALASFLREQPHLDVTTIAHPLVAEGPAFHEVSHWAAGEKTPHTRRLRRPHRPPGTYVFDAVTPIVPPKASVWFGFNNLAAARGLAMRRAGRVEQVVYWAVDFVPDRFGPGLLTKVYDRLDRLVCRSVDRRVELSEAAASSRTERLGLCPAAAPVEIVPMGAWLDRVPVSNPSTLEKRKVVFLGHLVPRMGVELLLDAVERLRSTGVDLAVDIIGGGPLLPELQQRVASPSLADIITLHGFVPDHREVERLLSEAAVAVAPYERDESSFTRFADPGKLKSYLAAGLPILLTDVPPNARVLESEAGARIVPWDAEMLAQEIKHLLDHPDVWQVRHLAALDYVRQFDWRSLLEPLVARLLSGEPDA